MPLLKELETWRETRIAEHAAKVCSRCVIDSGAGEGNRTLVIITKRSLARRPSTRIPDLDRATSQLSRVSRARNTLRIPPAPMEEATS
jgi:hypothetical protein